MDARIAKIKNAGIEAMTHFTIKKTIDMNGIYMSVTTTRCSSLIIRLYMPFKNNCIYYTVPMLADSFGFVIFTGG
jgi:hypothetical protein